MQVELVFEGHNKIQIKGKTLGLVVSLQEITKDYGYKSKTVEDHSGQGSRGLGYSDERQKMIICALGKDRGGLWIFYQEKEKDYR